MATSPYAFYIAGMDMNVDLIRGAVRCLRQVAPINCIIYVGVESYDQPIEGAVILHSESGKQWTGRVREHLKQIKEDKFVMLLEDYFIQEINNKSIEKLCDKMNALTAGVIKLHAVPKPDYGIAGQPNLGFFIHGKKMGRVNTQPALWKKSFLQSLLFDDESLWEFEVNSAVRSSALSFNILGVYDHLIDYDEVVKKGKFRNRFHQKYAETINDECIEKNRGFLSRKDELGFEMAHFFSSFLQKIFSQHHRTLLRRFLGL